MKVETYKSTFERVFSMHADREEVIWQKLDYLSKTYIKRGAKFTYYVLTYSIVCNSVEGGR